MTEIIKTVGVLVFKDDSVLLVEQKESAGHLTGTFGIPGGRPEENETEIQTAIRELKEESGLDTEEKNLTPLPNIYTGEITRKDGLKRFSFKVFLCRSFSGKLRGDHETEPKWIPIKEAIKLNLLPDVDQIIKDGYEQATS